MTYEPKGSRSAMTFDSIRRAERLQSLTLEQIHAQYATNKPRDLYSMTLAEFSKELEDATTNGTVDELNARYASFLEPLIQQILAPQQAGV